MSQTEAPSGSPPGTIVVALPSEMDYSNSQLARHQLVAAFGPDITTVIADMTSTAFCDSAGLTGIILARRTAAERNVELRIAVPESARNIRKLLQITGVDTVLPVYPSVHAALAGKSAT